MKEEDLCEEDKKEVQRFKTYLMNREVYRAQRNRTLEIIKMLKAEQEFQNEQFSRTEAKVLSKLINKISTQFNIEKEEEKKEYHSKSEMRRIEHMEALEGRGYANNKNTD